MAMSMMKRERFERKRKLKLINKYFSVSFQLLFFLQERYILHGAWDKGMTRKNTDGTGVKELWRANEPVPNWERQYGFTQFAMTLNEPDECELSERRGE